MKKILLVSLIAVLAVVLVGCMNNEDTNLNNPNDVVQSGDNQVENNPVGQPDEEDNENEHNSEELPGEGENEGEVVVSELEKKLNSLMEKSEVMLRMPMAAPIAAESAFTFIGLTEEEFNANVTEAISFESMIRPANQSVCLIELKDGVNASEIKNKVITNCNPDKWICMSAEKCMAIDDGKYVLLVMGTLDDCNALQNAFKTEFPNASEAVTK